ncbi:MAG TPA: M56 family metallopeptidase, partial [Bacteroidales bacterium]|nr:M56 family metallopeptidase [Bacteroidales bacterium]
MNSMMSYLAESTICLVVMYSVYWLLLRRDTFFQRNRCYLLAMVLFSLLFPFFSLPVPPSGSATSSFVVVLNPILITSSQVKQTISEHIKWIEIAGVIYLTIAFVLFLRFAFRLIQLYLIIRRFGIRESNYQKVVFTDRGYSPFSFFNLVFINDKAIPPNSLETILEHEKIHIKQFHTMDLVLLELAAIVQWFNPVIWLAGREMKILHEYLADEGVLQTGISSAKYQQMILEETIGVPVNGLTHNFNISILKKRILMMTKSKTGKWSKSKLVFVLPALLILWFISSTTSFSSVLKEKRGGNQPDTTIKLKQVQEYPYDTTPVMIDNRLVYKRCDVPPEYIGGDDARIKFLQDNIKYPQDVMKAGVQGKV